MTNLLHYLSFWLVFMFNICNKCNLMYIPSYLEPKSKAGWLLHFNFVSRAKHHCTRSDLSLSEPNSTRAHLRNFKTYFDTARRNVYCCYKYTLPLVTRRPKFTSLRKHGSKLGIDSGTFLSHFDKLGLK